MKKRILAMLTATMMVLGLAACGATDTKDGAGDTSAAGSSSSGDLIKVGIINNDPNSFRMVWITYFFPQQTHPDGIPY